MSELFSALRAPLPRPDGPFRLLAEDAAVSAFEAARRANRALRGEYDELISFELVEVHPALLGGDAETVDNKRAVDWHTHDQLMMFWDREAPPRGKLPPCEAASDLVEWADEDEWVIVRPNKATTVILRPLNAESPVRGLAVFATDGAGAAYAWGSGPDGEGVYELPAIPADPRLARHVGRTVSDLLGVRDC